MDQRQLNSPQGCSKFCVKDVSKPNNQSNPYAVDYKDPRHILIETNISDMLKKVVPTFDKEIIRYKYDFSCFPLKKPPLEKSYLPSYQMIQRSDYLRGYFQRLEASKKRKESEKAERWDICEGGKE